MWLTVRTGEERGKAIHVDGERVLLGRDETCDVTINDSKISRNHASLELRPDGTFVLRDLGSTNGTFVNGERVESAELRGAEQIQLGDSVLISSVEKPPEASGATVVGSIVGALRSHSESAIHRLLVQRSLRRVTVLAGAALTLTVAVGALVGIKILRSDDGDLSARVERVVRAAAPSTVLIEAQVGGVRVGSGTGWVLDGDERLVVTNAHVINGGRTFSIGANNTFYDAKVVGVAPCEDLAVLEVPRATGLKSMRLGDQASLALGETVVAVGYPENASQEANLTSTTGVVSVARSRYREAALDIPQYANVVQTDAAINPGNSGGPLLDLSGRLIGVNSAGRTIAPDGRVVQGENYAIGVDRVKTVTRVLRTGRSIGWSGLSFDYPTPKELARKRLPAGLVAARAVPGTGAARAGLGEARELILKVNGMRLTNSLAGYCDAVAGVQSGDRVTFTVLRPGSHKPRDVRVVME